MNLPQSGWDANESEWVGYILQIPLIVMTENIFLMSDFVIRNFKQINNEYIDVDYYEIDLENENIQIEISFQPIFIANNSIQLFIHVGYMIAGDEDEYLSLLHCDFITDITLNEEDIEQLRGKKRGIEKDKFSLILSESISMARGYLVCQLKGTSLGSFYLPVIDVNEIIKVSEHISPSKKNIILVEE